ncbi:response regulator [Thermogemmata fonticola]|jgi:CheY-like chemotaxis protein|uniref:Response regulator n=1 Tax=Thermogemmata fonticola TaxID=2755323 RepID=A0A7V8VB56_9BACT|nr:response regulator [Thermogemmata fonticola]MBA2224810.1 response regulator [Thermogemmata fonticola]
MSTDTQPESWVRGHGILLCDDLLFASRVLATARMQGCSLLWARDPATLLTWARQRPPTAVLLDLHHSQLALAQLLLELSSLCPSPPYCVAFGSHVDGERLESARRAGCHLVLPRSRFVAALDPHLQEWLDPTNPK